VYFLHFKYNEILLLKTKIRSDGFKSCQIFVNLIIPTEHDIGDPLLRIYRRNVPLGHYIGNPFVILPTRCSSGTLNWRFILGFYDEIFLRNIILMIHFVFTDEMFLRNTILAIHLLFYRRNVPLGHCFDDSFL